MATNKVVFGERTLIDLTADTVAAETLASGVTAHGADGRSITGTMSTAVTSVNGETGEVTLTAGDVGAAAVAGFTATLAASGWSASAPYTQSVTVSGLLGADKGRTDVNLAGATSAEGIEILEAWGSVSRIYASAANTLTAICYEDAPTVNIPIEIEVIR